MRLAQLVWLPTDPSVCMPLHRPLVDHCAPANHALLLVCVCITGVLSRDEKVPTLPNSDPIARAALLGIVVTSCQYSRCEESA